MHGTNFTDNRRPLCATRYFISIIIFDIFIYALDLKNNNLYFSYCLARAKKVINPSLTATPQQPSPERQVRSRQAGVSQSQRK